MSHHDAVSSNDANWSRVDLDEAGVAAAETAALGTSVRVVIWPPQELPSALKAVDLALSQLDRQASRFRWDSEISVLNSSEGDTFIIGDGLADVLATAVAAAKCTEGLVDPTVGAALIAAGYDRDFACLVPDSPVPLPPGVPSPGWSCVQLNGRLLQRPPGVVLDVGATAKGLGSDRAARAAYYAMGRSGGVLVALGGDIAVDGQCPKGGWPLLVTEDPDSNGRQSIQMVRLEKGGVATSSVTCRRWRRGGRSLHHIIDPRTGAPAESLWRTVSVAAPTCAMANAFSTALIVGGDEALKWFSETGLPARLVAHDGCVRLIGPWPESEGGNLVIPTHDHLGRTARALRNVA